MMKKTKMELRQHLANILEYAKAQRDLSETGAGRCRWA